MNLPSRAHQPTIRMLRFIDDLGKFIDSSMFSDEMSFRERVRTALERLDDMLIGDRHRFLVNMAESTGHPPRDIVRWPTGDARLADPEEWTDVLRAMHRYLSSRYVSGPVFN